MGLVHVHKDGKTICGLPSDAAGDYTPEFDLITCADCKIHALVTALGENLSKHLRSNPSRKEYYLRMVEGLANGKPARLIIENGGVKIFDINGAGEYGKE